MSGKSYNTGSKVIKNIGLVQDLNAVISFMYTNVLSDRYNLTKCLCQINLFDLLAIKCIVTLMNVTQGCGIYPLLMTFILYLPQSVHGLASLVSESRTLQLF